MARNSATLKCVECNRTKRVGLFYKTKGTKRGYSTRCKACYRRSDAARNALDRRYRKEYGITVDEYDVLLRQQGGRCFICRKAPRSRRLAVDHDHAVERKRGMRRSVRGLLCKDCNQYLGWVQDDPSAGQRLTEYLNDPPARSILGYDSDNELQG